MSTYIDTEGKSTYGVAICARCSRKFPTGELQADPTYPNLMVCRDDLDELDPYLLAARPPDDMTLPFVRPDDSVTVLSTSSVAALSVSDDGQRFLFTFP